MQSSISTVKADIEAKVTHSEELLKVRLFTETLERPHKHAVESDPFSSERYQEQTLLLKAEKRLNYPEQLTQRVSGISYKFGVFPLINAFYFYADNHFYFWDYEKPISINNPQYIRVEDKFIRNVGVFNAKSDFFEEQVKHILLMITNEKAMIYALYRDNDTWMAYYNPKDCLWAPTNGSSYDNLTGTQKGRILMSYKDKVYELVYQEEGWFRGSTSIKALTSSGYFDYLKFYGFSAGKDPSISSIVVDDTRNMTYILFSDNTIKVVYVYTIDTLYSEAYYLGKDGRAFIQKGEFHIYKNLETKVQQGHNPISMDSGNFLSIHPILKTESTSTCLVAISQFGYHSQPASYAGYQQTPVFSPFVDFENKEPEIFKLLFVLYPPPHPITSTGYPKIEMARYHNGLFFAQLTDVERAKLLLTWPNFGVIFSEINKAQATTTGYQYNQTEVISRTLLDIAEICNPQHDPIAQNDYTNELINQFSAPHRKFIFVSDEALTIVSKLRPVDHLTDILEKYRPEMPEPNKFLQNYGEIETAAMCFEIATRESHDFLLYFRKEPKTTTTPAGLQSIKRTPVSEGFTICLARTLRTIWKKNVLKPSPDRANPKRRDINFPPNVLNDIVQRLNKIKKFYEEYPSLSYSPENPNDAWKNEIQWLTDLYELTRNCADALSFILLMVDYNLPDTIASIPERSQPALWNSTFAMLMTDEQSKKNWKELVLAIIRRENRPQLDNLSYSLEQRCRSFCKAADVKIYQAYEELQQAKNSQDEHAKFTFLEKSLKLFLENIENMTYDTLENICHEYEHLSFHDGAIELALSGSKAPGVTNRAPYHDLAIESMKSAEVFSRGSPKKVMPELRNKVLNKSLNIGAKIKDNEFLYKVYDEFYKEDSIRNLFEVPAPYLEEYFKDNDSSSKIGKLRLYCEFLIRHNQYVKAAEIQYQLATSEHNFNLEDRLECLSYATGYMKAGVGYSAPSNAMEKLKEYEDLLQIGQVQNEIYQRLSTMFQDRPEAQQVLNLLNTKLLDKQQLWDNFIHPYELYDCTLDLLTVSEPPDMDLVSSIWQNIIRKARSYEELSDEVIRLGRKYYPSELLVFPPWLICRILATYCVNNPEKPKPDWIVNIFLQVKVPHNEIFHILVELHSERPPPLNQAAGLHLILEEIVQLINRWKNDPSAMDLNPQYVCEVISNYTEPSPGSGADQALTQQFVLLKSELQFLV
ncbi:3153_t:CDS:10 [Ambispora leptoticha]|uniref:3153_t:CDS:1 n=1 Tax=Ambispora leptoticha TaxID=144679 RepID=A0A9N8ZW57_9GLOM|nr:3153_t:CDS:10 [Ambispora leptoticha]